MRRAVLLAVGVAAGVAALAVLPSGCGSGAPGQARRYVDAATSGGGDACAALADDDLRGECLVFAAAEVGPSDPAAAEALCTQAPPGVWQDECWFHLADTLSASGDLALSMCNRAGRFRDPCLGHAVSRDSRQILASLPPGQEQQALAALTDAAVAYLGNERGRARARQNLVKALAARFLDGPFDPEGCGDAPDELCTAVYRELLTLATAQSRGPGRGSGDGLFRIVCEQGATLPLVEQLGLPVWTPAGEALALRAWQELCDQHQSAGGRGGRRPGPPPVGR